MSTAIPERVTQWIADTKAADDWHERRRAIISLGYEKDESIVPALLESLKDPVSEVRHAAIIALGRLGAREAVPELLKPKILASPDANIRWAAVSALGKLGDHRIIDDLVHLAEDEEWLVRNEALTVLKERVRVIIAARDVKRARVLIRMLAVEDPEIVDMAVDGLHKLGRDGCPLLADGLDSVRPEVRRHAARALGLAGDRRCVPRIVTALSSDPNASVRAEAATALGRIGDRRGLPALVASMRDYDDETRERVVEAVVRFGKDATKPLAVALGHGGNVLARCIAIRALGEIGDPRSVPVLIDHLSSSYYIVRMASITALAQYGLPVAESLVGVLSYNKTDITSLCEQADDTRDIQTRIRAVKALGDLEDHRAAPLLKTMLSDPCRELSLEAQNSLTKIGCAAWRRAGALSVLGRIGAEEAVPDVLDLLEDDSAHVRRQAVQTLGELGDDRAVGALDEITRSDPDSEVRRMALTVLHELAAGEEMLFDLSMSVLEDESYDVRAEAARIMGDFSDERAVGPLIKRLSDYSRKVRLSAESALSSQGRRVVPKLIEVLQGDSLVARRRAMSALGRIGDVRAIEPIEQVLEHEQHRGTVSLGKEVLKLLRGEKGRSTT